MQKFTNRKQQKKRSNLNADYFLKIIMMLKYSDVFQLKIEGKIPHKKAIKLYS